jgi:cytochrome P450
MREATDRAIESMPVGRPFELLPVMQSITLDVIMSAVFGIERGPRQDEMKRRIRAMIEPVASRAGMLLMLFSAGRLAPSGLREFDQRRRALDDLIFAEIAGRRDAADLEERADVLSMLLLARDEDGQAMTDRELRDELVTLLVAGHETTATGLAWAFDLLLHEPRVLASLEASLTEGDETYLDAVVKETLRVRPVVPGVGRVVRGEPFQLGPYLIPGGVEINPSIAAIHRRSDCYPQPQQFRPERFLGDDVPDGYTWLPFGGGTRRCLGASFATFEMRATIRRMLERTRLRAVDERPEEGLRRGVTIVPRRGVRVLQESAPVPAPPDAALAAAIAG